MAAKTYDVAEDEDKMMEPEEVCDNLEIVEPAVPSTSSANNSSSHFKMLRREAHVDDVNEFDNIELTFPSTSTARYRRWPRFRMLQRADAIQEEDEDEIESNGHDSSPKSIQSAIPSTSISASHSISYHSLIRERNYLKFEIDNIGKVMKCCKNAVKRWLSVIDDEAFPEEEYLQEYIEGTNTLHELQRKEMELVAKQEKILELVKLRRNAKEETSMKKVVAILIVHLPNNQHTSIQVQKGLTLRNAVSKAMQRRHLIIDDCAAYIKHRITSCFISWDTDISTLQCKEVFVETLEAITVPVYYLHHFARNTFLNIKLSYCYFCEKSVLYGFHCKLCDRKYHMKCVAFAPILCEHIKRRRAYYERLLANNMTTGIIQIRARPPPTPSSMAKKRRENQENQESSTSLPNVAINLDTEVSKTKDEIFKTKDEVSKTKDVVFKIKDGVSKPKDGVSKTKDELSKTKDGISKARVGVFKKNGVFKEGIFKTKDGIFKTKSEVSKTKDLTVIQEDKKNTEITVKKRKQKKHEKSTNENDSHVDDIERKKSNDSEDSIFSHQDSINDFKIIAKEVSYEPEKIGQGTYGSVYKGDWHGPVAVKRLNIEVPTAEQIRTFKNEVNILRKIRHKHVLLFMGCICKPYLAIITQWCEGQSLHHRLHVDEDPLEMITIVIILKQTSEGMDYLHARNIHHRDLKSYNIFFHNGLHVKIGDFGLAVMRNQFSDKKDENEKHGEDEEKEKDAKNEESEKDEKDQESEKEKAEREKAEKEEKARKEQENKLAGSIPWMAPEVLRMKEDYPYSFQSDVYSFGIVMFELFAREIPYGLGADPLFILYNVGRGNLAPDSTKMRSDTPRKLKVLYKQCIAFEKEKRPLFPYILKQVYSVFRATPKIRRTTSLPLKTDELADTYIERDEDVQDFLTSDDDYEAIFCSNTGINAISSVTAEDIFADF